MWKHVISLFFAISFYGITDAQIKLPRLLRDSMILQRDIPVKIWGSAASKEKIKISFNNKTYAATADDNGQFAVMLPATKAGGPYTIEIKGATTIQLKDILFGDVWICSGQSNMVHQMGIHNVRYEKKLPKPVIPISDNS